MNVEQIFSVIFAGVFLIIFSREHRFIELFRQLHVFFPLFFIQYHAPDFVLPQAPGGIFNGGIAAFGKMFKSPPPPPPPPNRKKNDEEFRLQKSSI